MEPAEAPEPVVVEAKRTGGTATDRVLDRAAIEAMPGSSADDLLRAMPGMHISAHGGQGKAYQYFLRGFDAVHGADIAVSLEGVPINEVSNVHGHGYVDLHFIPPILVRSVALRPGTWRADTGDFAVAGSAAFKLGLEDAGGQAWLGGGTDLSGATTLAWRPERSLPGTFLVADATVGRGVGDARAWRQLRAGAGWEGTLGSVGARGWALAYDGVFESPGVVREDDFASGAMGFYDAYPGSGGGASRRVLAGLEAVGGARAPWRASVYGGWRALDLEQNYTGYVSDALYGDGTVQHHEAGVLGGQLSAVWTAPLGLLVSAGVHGRADVFTQSQAAVDRAGEVWRQDSTLSAQQGDIGAWATAPWSLTRWLLVEPGLRADLFLVHPDPADPRLSWAPVLAPKLALTLFSRGPVTGFANYGRGFRSPEARGTAPGEVAPVALSDSAEVGVRAAVGQWVQARAAGFGTLVSDEIVFDHAAARFLATGRTRRVGVHGGLTVTPLSALRVEADLTYSDGVYVATGDAIPYAPRVLLVGGVYVQALPLGPLNLSSGLRGWWLGPRPLPGGFSSTSAGVLDLTTTVDWQRWSASFDIDNVLGTRWRDGEFVFASRWDPEGPESELPVRHFTAGAARVARLSIGRMW